MSENVSEKKPERTLVLVDKAKLAELRATLAAAADNCRADPSAGRMWLFLGTLTSVLDGVLAELTVR